MSIPRKLYYFIAVSVVSSLAISYTSSIMPYFILSLNMEMKVYGLIQTLARLIALLVRIPFSAIIPSYGYFKSYAMGYSMGILSQMAYIAVCITPYALFFYTIGSVFVMLRFATTFTARSSIVARFTDSSNRGFVFGLISSLNMVTSSIGPFIGSLLYEATGGSFVAVFMFSLTTMMLAIVMLIPLIKNDIKVKKSGVLREEFKLQLTSIPAVFRNPKLRKILFIFMLDGFCWSIAGAYTSIYFAEYLHLTPMDLSYLNLVTNIVNILTFTLIGWISDKLRKRGVFLAVSEVFGILYFLLILEARDITLLYFASAIMGFVASFWSPIASAYITEAAEEESRDLVPLAIGIRGFLGTLARMLGTLIGGLIYDINPWMVFRVPSLMLIIIILIILLFLRD